MQNLGQLTTSELNGLIRHASALVAMQRALPPGLYIKLDTYLADLHVEVEDRAALELVSSQHARAASQAM